MKTLAAKGLDLSTVDNIFNFASDDDYFDAEEDDEIAAFKARLESTSMDAGIKPKIKLDLEFPLKF